MLVGRLRGLGFDPAHGDGSFVEEAVRAAHAGPDVIASFHMVGLAVEDGFGLAAQEEIGFLEGVVVDIALASWLKLYHEESQVLRAKHFIYQHFEGDAEDVAAPVAVHLQLAVRRHLRVIEVAEVARGRVAEIGTLARGGRVTFLEEKDIAFLPFWLWLGREHFQPARGLISGIAPGVGNGSLENAVVVLCKLVVVSVDAHQHLSFQEVEGLFVKMHMCIQGAAGIELAETQAGMHRAGDGVVNQRDARVATAVFRVGGGYLERHSIVVCHVMHNDLLLHGAD